MLTMDVEEGVILVVGSAREAAYKARVAEALADGRGATEVETTKGGVRIFRTNSSPEAVILETTPLAVTPCLDPAAEAAQWISRNALRKLFGKLISVVCVVSSSGPNDPLHQVEHALKQKTFTWLNLLGYIFKEHQEAITVLVKLEGTGTSDWRREEAMKAGVIDVLKREGFAGNRISFEILKSREDRGEDLPPIIRSVLESSVCHRRKAKHKVQNSAHFRLKEVTATSSALDKYGHWGPERMILIGRTGSGKSTVCEMLTKGRLDHSDTPSSSGIRGKTKDIRREEGRGWHVVDTPGFGELPDLMATIPSKKAEKILKRFVRSIEGTYTHFIYVFRKGRSDLLDKALWDFFKLLFSVESTKASWAERMLTTEFNLRQNFTVVVCDATPEWVNDNIKSLKETFDGCDSFLSCDFPPIATGDEELETENLGVRIASLKGLEDELASLSRFPYHCQFGFFSKSTIGTLRSDMALWTGELKGVGKVMSSVESALAKVLLKFERFLAMLKSDKNVVLSLRE